MAKIDLALNETERQTLLRVLNAAKHSFKDVQYSEITESYPADDYFTCYLDTMFHIKAIDSIIKKLKGQ